LLNELAEKLAETQILDATDRERELRAFAEQQSPRVLALEQEAERLRGDLIKGSLLTSSIEWNITRSWRLGEAALANDPVKIDAEFRVARAAAFYEDGLGLEQRGLMRELSIELERSARAARRRPQAADDYPRAMFFSPETARLQLPTDRLPAGLVAKIGSFNRDKTILKDELRATMSAVDNLSAAKRAARFKELTEKQWPRVCALESQAEEIRRELAGVAGPPPPWLPPISPDLRQRIDTYAHERNQVLADYSEAQRRARSEVKFPTELFRRTPAERERMLRDLEQRMRDAGATASKEFERVNAERITALHERYEILRAELAVLAAATKDPKTGQPMTVQSLLTAYRVSNQHFDAVGREEVIYANYRIAMMQPGLSPAQRRLLFTAAHAGLAQPLPAGEYTRGQQARPSAVY
jgi:hypothetical protein